jgi:hypothetical protein
MSKAAAASHDWYALDCDVGGTSYRVLFLIPFPAGMNSVDQPIQECLVNSGIGGTLPAGIGEGTGPGQVTPEDVARIKSGAVYPILETHIPNVSDEDLRQTMDERFAALAAEQPAILQARLKCFGATA